MIRDFNIRVAPEVTASMNTICQRVVQEFNVDEEQITSIRIIHKSIDARHRNVFINLTVRVFLEEEPPEEIFLRREYPDISSKQPVIVVGEGPAGLFSALRLIELGFKPVIIERGKSIKDRRRDIATMLRTHTTNTESNFCFGEGGAGTFSDGKLFTRSKKRGDVIRILEILCQHGASTIILSDAHPHIGTDRLPSIVLSMRKTIENSGGKVYNNMRMTGLIIEGKRVKGIEAINTLSGDERTFYGPVILATGHSARDVYHYLYRNNIDIEAKGIAVGVRVEHPSSLIDRLQYHNPNGRGQYLPAAEYSFVTQIDNRGVYSFCMCPGGFIVPTATCVDQLSVNGMSPSSRGGQWSNSGIVVEVLKEDISGESPLRIMEWQEEIEHQCWLQGGMHLLAPAQRMVDFVSNRLSSDLPKSSYLPKLTSSPLHFWLPKMISQRLQMGFKVFGKMCQGFLTNEASVIGVESKTSSPVRILRNKDTLMHVCLSGLFPCGEGAGYSGGIVSSAIDGERCAEMCARYLNT